MATSKLKNAFVRSCLARPWTPEYFMKSNFRFLLTVFTFALSLLLAPAVRAQGTAFTYQGWLMSDTSPANGSYDLTFALFDSPSGGAQEGNTLTNTAIGVSNGLFTVTLDFGSQFPRAAPRSPR